jgi:hypothetical protein
MSPTPADARCTLPQTVTVPRIPDDAFMHLLERVVRITALIPFDASSADVQEVADNFYRALGLDGDWDDRAVRATRVALGHLREIEPEDVPPDDVSAAMLGIMLGLLLAQGTGWEPPLIES